MRLFTVGRIRVGHRAHYRGFREWVLSACQDQCALCRLRHLELINTAHTIPANVPGGDPIVNNAITIFKLQKVDFDKFFLVKRSDYGAEIRAEVL